MNVYERIVEHLSKPRTCVMIATYTRITVCKPKHLELFKEPKKESEKETGVYFKRGKRLEFVLRDYLRLVTDEY